MFDILTYGALKRYTSAEQAKLVYVKPELMTYADIQRVVRLGDTDKIFTIGDQLMTEHATYGDIVWDIVDISDAGDTAMVPEDTAYFTKWPNAKPLVLLTRPVLANVQFSAPQANFKVLAAIPAGAANITLTSSDVASGTGTCL